MKLKLCVLASGSSGNCIFVGTENTRILIDAGLSARQTAQRLAEIGEQIEKIDAVCLSHEHHDHTAGLRVLQKTRRIPVYANGGTLEAVLQNRGHADLTCCRFMTGSSFTLGDLVIDPFSVSHDAYEPVGFVIHAGRRSIGIVTDIGIVTHLVREKLRGCYAVVMEANHDEDLLHAAGRPWSLKQRIRGNQGHLSNRAAAALAVDIACGGVEHLFLAHMSMDCNCPVRARTVFETLLMEAGYPHIKICLTKANAVSEILELE